jgi:hypothetical protein
MAKQRKPVIDDEDEDEDGGPAPEPIPAPVRKADSGILDLEGYGGEVASALVVNGLRAYLSVVNRGVNVVAANRAHTQFIPVRVEACGDQLDIRRDEAKVLVEGQGVLAFLIGEEEDRLRYYVPVSEYLEMAEDRGETGLRLDMDEHEKWLEKYEGHAGVRRAFSRLM